MPPAMRRWYTIGAPVPFGASALTCASRRDGRLLPRRVGRKHDPSSLLHRRPDPRRSWTRAFACFGGTGQPGPGARANCSCSGRDRAVALWLSSAPLLGAALPLPPPLLSSLRVLPAAPVLSAPLGLSPAVGLPPPLPLVI